MTSARLTTILLVVVPAVYLIYKTAKSYWGWRRRVILTMKLPGKKSHWFYGHLADYPGPEEKEEQRARHYISDFPRLSYIWRGPVHLAVAINHPNIVKAVLKSSEPKPLGIGGYSMVRPWLGDGLLVSGGTQWARNRRLLTPAFHFDILKPYMSINNKCTETFLNLVEPYAASGQSFEVFKHISHLTLDIILRCAFTYDTDCQIKGNHPYIQAINEMSDIVERRFYNPFLLIDWIFNLTTSGRCFRQHCDYVHNVSDDIINKRKQTLIKEGSSALRSGRYLDFLDILLTAKDEDNVGLSDIQIRNEVDTFLFEGHDTTASGISWTLYALASNPKIQKKCQEEIDQVLVDRDSDIIEWEDLGKLKYLSQCIKEALRLYSPVPFIERELTKDVTVDGYTIPAGSVVDLDLYCVHHNPLIWDGSMVYDPDRFSPENIDKISTYAFVPFSAGPRNCIGQHFAMHEMKVVIARILRRYDLSIHAEKGTKMRMLLVMKTVDGMFLKLKARKLNKYS